MPTKFSPQAADRLLSAARAAAAAGHGERLSHWQAAADDLGVSLQTALRWRQRVSVAAPRKRRSDHGAVTLTEIEAETIAALVRESHRRNGKRLLSLEQAVLTLRANGLVRAGAVDPETGEIRPLSIGAVARGLRQHGFDPGSLNRAAPAISLASRHPNHVWQIDASLCVLYYLRPSAAPDAGLQVMTEDVFYKNKPGNVAKIETERVWRYAVTDHASGHIYVEYVLGAESGENLCNIFINAMQRRPDEPVHGVPLLVMLDPGSANTGALFKNLCQALTARVQINQVKNPRAKGQVEQAHNLIERTFESGLKLVRIDSLDALNLAAARWRRWFNGSQIHTRHGQTRYAAWMRISAEQLRIAPEVAICRELATTAPESRLVDDKLQVSFRGRKFDVSVVPEIQNGAQVMVCRNPWRPEAAQVVGRDDDGRQIFYVIEPVQTDSWGFAEVAPVIGERYVRHADTPAQTAAKAVERLLMGADTDAAAAEARKAKALPFAGAIDPWRHMDEANAVAPAYLPKRGTALETPLPGVAAGRSEIAVPSRMAVEAAPLSLVELAARLRERAPDGWSAVHYRQLAALHPDGAPETEIPAIAARLFAAPRLAAAG